MISTTTSSSLRVTHAGESAAFILTAVRCSSDTNSGGHSVQNGIPFGGSADGNDHIGPNGVKYNFGSLVYCEARYGTQPAGDVITGLTANDPAWSATANGSPTLQGCTYVYLKVEYDEAMFPGEPEIRFTVYGKEIFDPRTNLTTYSSNWALIVADVLTDTEFGLGDVGSVNTAQLIAAANVCDEQVALAKGGTESRYAAHIHFDTATSPGDMLQTLMPAAMGQLSRIGGEWYIWPASWRGASFSWDAGALIGDVQWSPTRSFRDLYNVVTGTYIAPNYPYNVAGNLYDTNGFYMGEIQNNFSFAFQPTNYPQYSCDPLHGYAADEYLAEDGGQTLTKEVAQQCCLSVSQAQRCAKIALLRNRQQGTGTLRMALGCMRMQPLDVMLLDFPAMGWDQKPLEINSFSFTIETDGDSPRIVGVFGVNETAQSVYEWSAAEELTVYSVPAVPTQTPYVVAPPENVTLTSSAATASMGKDGIVTPRIQIQWDTPLDLAVDQVQVQYQTATSAWMDAALLRRHHELGLLRCGCRHRLQRAYPLKALHRCCFCMGGDRRIYFGRGSYRNSAGNAYGQGTLTGEAYSNGTAAIDCATFTATIGSESVIVLPSGAQVTGLQQQQLYYVYYVDPNFQGGAVTPIATQVSSDFTGKPGYFLIDSIITPMASSSSTPGSPASGARYAPSLARDTGTRTTTTPAAAYDGNTSSAAVVSAQATASNQTYGLVTYSGFPQQAINSPLTGTVTCTSVMSSNGTYSITAQAGNTPLTSTATNAGTTFAIPANTDLSTIYVQISVYDDGTVNDNGKQTVETSRLSVYEIYIM